MMSTLNLPPYQAKIIRKGEVLQIFDEFRKKYVKLTPEEWVRQNLCHYLVNHLGYPAGRMVLEGKIIHNGIEGRFDVLIYDDIGKAVLVVECKSSDVKLSNATADQAIRYAKASDAKAVLLSNGLEHFYFRIQNDGFVRELEIPIYTEA